MDEYVTVFVLGFMELVMVMPMCHGGKLDDDIDDTSAANSSSLFVSGWSNIEEMEADIDSYRERSEGFSLEYMAHIKQRIEAMVDVDEGNRDQIENALRILWVCRSRLSTIESIIRAIIRGINNGQYTLGKKAEQGNPIALALQKAQIAPTDGRKDMNDLMDVIESTSSQLAEVLYGKSDKDFADLAIFMAFLYDNLKQYNSFYGFGSVLVDMLELYECTRNDGIRKIIKNELRKVPHGDGKVGPYGDKIEKFPRSLKRILRL
ncbi:MAG: hypothetical protein LBH08_00145 [Puniceicoccales bacterium]|jgi:hypothetical protein|nr:hypothetical protein [Puniceicoccales bacterium]